MGITYKFFTIFIFLCVFSASLSQSIHKGSSSSSSVHKCQIFFNGFQWLEKCQHSESQDYMYSALSNFYSRYVNGNRNSRGIKLAHYNKGNGRNQSNN